VDLAALERIGPALSETQAHSAADLPPADTQRWVVRRKAAVVAAVQSGKITLEEACRRYRLTPEEFGTWQRAYQAHGLPGLRATRLQMYRAPPSSRPGRPRR
jgi:transposase-like protein